VATPDLDDAGGVVEMFPAAAPTTVALSPEGHHRYELSVTIDGLPEPSRLGAYSLYVAWLTTPGIAAPVRLGVVGNGSTRLGPVELDKFLILVSAESTATVEHREGRLVLRGASPSGLMLGHGPSMLPLRRGSPLDAHEHGPSGWVMPPMHPAAPVMVPGLEDLRPGVAPFLPHLDSGLVSKAGPNRTLDLADGGTLRLTAVMVRRTIEGRDLVMYAFDGQSPGPLIRVKEGAAIVVDLFNRIDQPTAVHWHGVRLENRFDGVPGVTQPPVPPGGRYRYIVRFPDPGVYWYHPHQREDIQQDLGLYGNILVTPRPLHAYSLVNREVAEEDARRAVDYWAEEGATWLKFYTTVSRSVMGAAIDQAHRRGLKVTGHLCSVSFREAVALGIDNLEHGLLVNTDMTRTRSPTSVTRRACSSCRASILGATRSVRPSRT
jgi:hypothetical protein